MAPPSWSSLLHRRRSPSTCPPRSPSSTWIVEKADFGPLSLVVSNEGRDTELARLDYASCDRAAYEARAGIVDIDVSKHKGVEAVLAGGALTLHGGGSVLLAEQELTAVSDDCNIYLDQEGSRTLVLRVRERGAQPTLPASVLVATYDAEMKHTGQTQVLPVSPDSTATVEIRAQSPGYLNFGFTVFRGESAPTPPSDLEIDVAQFTSIRTLPFDDQLEVDTPDTALTWDFIYANVLQTYDAIAPRMSHVIRLDDAATVATFARRFKGVTSVELFESRRYMPITRALSRGKRKLLHRFCDTVGFTGPSAEPSTERSLAAAAPAAATRASSPPPAGVPADETFTNRAR